MTAFKPGSQRKAHVPQFFHHLQATTNKTKLNYFAVKQIMHDPKLSIASRLNGQLH
jgi:hypothetical protein